MNGEDNRDDKGSSQPLDPKSSWVSEREFEEQNKFRSQLVETNGFDIEHLMNRKPSSYILKLRNYGNYSTEVLVYAKMGFISTKGKNLQLSHVERHLPISSAYYITLVAKDGDALVPFQTNVVEELYDMSLNCGTARLKDDPVEPESSSVHNFISFRFRISQKNIIFLLNLNKS